MALIKGGAVISGGAVQMIVPRWAPGHCRPCVEAQHERRCREILIAVRGRSSAGVRTVYPSSTINSLALSERVRAREG
jgi:hypothetical protein